MTVRFLIGQRVQEQHRRYLGMPGRDVGSKIRLQEALNRMDPLERGILVLRHYEQMTNGSGRMDPRAGGGPSAAGGRM